MRISDWSSDVCSSDLKIALPILTIFAFGSLFNQLQGRQSEPTSIFVDNPRIIDGDTLEAADEKRVRLLGIDAPDDDGNGNVTKIAAQLYLEELVKRNGGMDCTSEFQDQPLTVEPLRSAGRRVGNEGVRTGGFRWAPDH